VSFFFWKKTVLKDKVKGLYWALYGRTIRNPDIPLNVRSILFICKGNICRSPFAEHIAKIILEELSSVLAGCEISSAGIRVWKPDKPPAEAIISAKHFGVELQGHKSRLISYEMMESYDMIIVMETWQFKYLRNLFLEFDNKVYLLPLFECHGSGKKGSYLKYNIQDPYGRKIEDYKDCFDRISSCISVLISKYDMNPSISRDNQ
jgi:protein-tyrosine phosphatase